MENVQAFINKERWKMKKQRLHKLIKKANTEEKIMMAQQWLNANIKDNNLYRELMVLLSQNETK